jgi:phospholipid N-methyltransferase
MSDRWLFARRFLQRVTAVASLTPSSRALAGALCAAVDKSRPQVLLELGAGTGAVTAMAAERMHPDSRLVAIEIDPVLAVEARKRVPRAEIVCGDAAEVGKILEQRKVGEVDVVLSGLPVPSLPHEVCQRLFEALAERAPGATYHQLTVMPWVYLRLYQRLFEQVSFELVPWNLPPGGVYHCARLREGQRRPRA